MNSIWKRFARKTAWRFSSPTPLPPRVEAFLKTVDRAALAGELATLEQSPTWEAIRVFVNEERLNHELLMHEGIVGDPKKAAYELGCFKSFTYFMEYMLPACRAFVATGKMPGFFEEAPPEEEDNAANE